MRIAISVLAILFGALHAAAAFTRFKAKDPAERGFAIVMFCGGVGAVFESAAHLTGANQNWMDALAVAASCLLVWAAAFANGQRKEREHRKLLRDSNMQGSPDLHEATRGRSVSHHIIRGAVAVLIVVGFLVW